MLHPMRYRSRIELAPAIAEALTAQGYSVAIPRCLCGTESTTLLTDGTAEVLLAEATQTGTVEIEISGAAGALAAQLLESLPIPIDKKSSGIRNAVD